MSMKSTPAFSLPARLVAPALAALVGLAACDADADPTAPPDEPVPAGFETPSPVSAEWDAFFGEKPAADPTQLDALDGTWEFASSVVGVLLRLRVRGSELKVGVDCFDRSFGVDLTAQVSSSGPATFQVVVPSSPQVTVHSAIQDEMQLKCVLGVGGESEDVVVKDGKMMIRAVRLAATHKTPTGGGFSDRTPVFRKIAD